MRKGLLGIAVLAGLAAATPSGAQETAAPEPAYAPFDAAGSAPPVRLPGTAGVPVSAAPTRAATTPSPAAQALPPRTAPPKSADRAEKAPSPRTPAATQRAGQAASAAKPRYVEGMRLSGKAKVLDGSVLVISATPVRLEGVDAPGLAQVCKTPAGLPWKCGAAAMRALAEVAQGEPMTCTVAEQSGEGASAVCSVRGIPDLGRYMVDRGLAVPNVHGRLRYGKAADQARSVRAGLWTGTFEAPWTWRLRNR